MGPSLIKNNVSGFQARIADKTCLVCSGRLNVKKAIGVDFSNIVLWRQGLGLGRLVLEGGGFVFMDVGRILGDAFEIAVGGDGDEEFVFYGFVDFKFGVGLEIFPDGGFGVIAFALGSIGKHRQTSGNSRSLF
ncbi:hypothetical protein PROH_15275 [Prochlorothrix hollandica PCC 9006 = CALU 1027]|uniref:Uncharacterized protein n=1 Tax=Prochlorothrix hollandica PCC 9006 = CALU 1027 TaxID=317619 RepID=A0A0M2PSN6_PROHO|nr:hypothetical protein [Prochlorothrix hollandica]KKI99134.1 hypothetical protein PROH_15275 [Prochlorothrix hollandica PCC 9006 = CALU 1027]